MTSLTVPPLAPLNGGRAASTDFLVVTRDYVGNVLVNGHWTIYEYESGLVSGEMYNFSQYAAQFGPCPNRPLYPSYAAPNIGAFISTYFLLNQFVALTFRDKRRIRSRKLHVPGGPAPQEFSSAVRAGASIVSLPELLRRPGLPEIVVLRTYTIGALVTAAPHFTAFNRESQLFGVSQRSTNANLIESFFSDSDGALVWSQTGEAKPTPGVGVSFPVALCSGDFAHILIGGPATAGSKFCTLRVFSRSSTTYSSVTLMTNDGSLNLTTMPTTDAWLLNALNLFVDSNDNIYFIVFQKLRSYTLGGTERWVRGGAGEGGDSEMTAIYRATYLSKENVILAVAYGQDSPETLPYTRVVVLNPDDGEIIRTIRFMVGPTSNWPLYVAQIIGSDGPVGTFDPDNVYNQC